MLRIFLMSLYLLMFPFAIYHLSMSEILLGLFIGWLCFGIGISAVLHRYVSHRSYEFKNQFFKIISYIIAFMSGLGDPIIWALVHRQHHRYTDTKLDTQSPLQIGKFRVFISAFEIPSGTEYINKQLQQLSSDKLNIFFAKYQILLLILYPALLYYFFGLNVFLILVGLSVPMAFVMQGYINATLHDQPLEDGIYSKNMSGSLFWFGENLHKSHHINSKQIAHSDWDLAKYYILLVGNNIKENNEKI